MESFFTRYRNALVLLLVLVVQLLALAVQARRPSASDSGGSRAVSMLRYAVVTVITPPEKVLSGFGGWIEGIWGGYVDLIHVRRDNAELRDQLERLRLEQASVAEDARQAQRLQALLGFKEKYIYKTVPAQVVGSSGTDQSHIVYIDKGSNDGIEPDMPVVTQDGIVGRIKEVFPSTSQLMLISDATSGVGVILETTRIRGVLKGAPYGGIQVVNVSPDERIKAGERVLTSGGDQIFPRGLPVGTVERVQPDPDRDPLQDVLVKPAAHLSELEEVLVITNMGDAASAQEARDLAESEAEGAAAQKRASDILSERLPSRLDPNAPADSNPDSSTTDDTGITAQPLHPPATAHPDGFTPDMTPPASEMTPGARTVPVREGTEDQPPARTQPRPAAPASAAGPEAAGSSAAGLAGTHPAGSVAGSVNGRVAGSVAASVAGTPHAAHPAGEAGSSAAPGVVVHHVPAKPANPDSTNPAPATPGSANPVSPTHGATTHSSTGASAPLRPGNTTHVIVDGPETRPSHPVTPGAAATAPGQKPAPKPVHRGPVLVPDDGSRPPSAKKPAQQEQSRPSTPQGRRA